MFDLYIANKNYSSWSLRPWVLLKTLEIPFNEHLMPFEGGLWGEPRDLQAFFQEVLCRKYRAGSSVLVGGRRGEGVNPLH